MRGEPKYAAVVDALSLEDSGAVMQRVGENMGLGSTPFDERAIQPDISVAIGHG